MFVPFYVYVCYTENASGKEATIYGIHLGIPGIAF